MTVAEAIARLKAAQRDDRDAEVARARVSADREKERTNPYIHPGKWLLERGYWIVGRDDDDEELADRLERYAAWLRVWRQAGIYDGGTELVVVNREEPMP